MTANPFLNGSALNLPLDPDICQRMHYSALRMAARWKYPSALPPSVHIDPLRQSTHLQGAAAYMAHPAEVERIFTGITLSVYRTIEHLYCSRLGRSIKTVEKILNTMADQANVPQVDYEAVWAIGLYLDERRTAETAVTIERDETTWLVARLTPDVHLQNSASAYRPSIVCVLDTQHDCVLAFRVTDDATWSSAISLAAYDALVSQRRPSQNGAAGLVWRLPARINAQLELPPDCQTACSEIGIDMTQTNSTTPLLDSLRGNWSQDLTGLVLSRDRFALLFNNYLTKLHGYGPLSAQEQRDREFVHLVGYNRDPAWQFPALRSFLSMRNGTIAPDSTVELDGLHYADELLVYWPGRQVSLCRSAWAEASAWIYLDGEILSEAWASELRRQDGSYRPNRAGR